MTLPMSLIGAGAGLRDRLADQGIELGVAERRGQIGVDDRELRIFLGDQIGATAGLELRDRLAALLDHLFEHAEHLRVVER